MLDLQNPEKVQAVLDKAALMRGWVMTRYGNDPLDEVFAALLYVAAEVAHSQNMSNVDFRRIARDVYNHQKEVFDDQWKGTK